MLPMKAPTAAMRMLRAISLLAPNLSEKSPAGIEISTWHMSGIAAIIPICWLLSLNSSFNTGNRVEFMFPAAWTSACIRTEMRSPRLRSFNA